MANVAKTSCTRLAVGVRGPDHTRGRSHGMTNDKAHASVVTSAITITAITIPIPSTSTITITITITTAITVSISMRQPYGQLKYDKPSKFRLRV